MVTIFISGLDTQRIDDIMDPITLARNVGIYVFGLAMSIAGALGLVAAIDIQPSVAALLFLVGLGLVISVHEWLDGPF